MRHYVDVTGTDFERAVGVEAAQHAHARGRSEPHRAKAAHEKNPVLQGAAPLCDTLQNRGTEAAEVITNPEV
jgi:hypothetical protein